MDRGDSRTLSVSETLGLLRLKTLLYEGVVLECILELSG